MKITAIQAQVKRAGRYSIFIDGSYSFSLSGGALLDERLVPGEEIDDDRLRQLRQRSAEDKIYAQALQYVALRPRSTGEMRDYMRRKQVSEAVQQQILDKLRQLQLVDDLSFARSWVENRRLLKHSSRQRLRQELRQKHVSDDIISEVLAEDAVDDRSSLRELVARKRRQVKYQDDTKLMQYLARQGFAYDDIKAVLDSNEIDG